MHLFRGVDEQKEESERSGHGRCDFKGKLFHAREELVKGGSFRCTSTPLVTGLSQALDGIKDLLTFKPENHLSQCSGEPARVLIKWLIDFLRRRIHDIGVMS
jgi:hypothetical protein